MRCDRRLRADAIEADVDGDPIEPRRQRRLALERLEALPRAHERVTQVNGFEIEVTPAGHMVFFTYIDRPGIIGTVGTLLGDHDINIATMDVGRKAEGGEALMCLTVDTEVPTEVPAIVADRIEANQLRTVTLPPA